MAAVLGTGAAQKDLVPALMRCYAAADHVVGLDVDKVGVGRLNQYAPLSAWGGTQQVCMQGSSPEQLAVLHAMLGELMGSSSGAQVAADHAVCAVPACQPGWRGARTESAMSPCLLNLAAEVSLRVWAEAVSRAHWLWKQKWHLTRGVRQLSLTS